MAGEKAPKQNKQEQARKRNDIQEVEMSESVKVTANPILNMGVPQNLISEELEGIYGTTVLAELGEIIGYYKVYEAGAEFTAEGSNGDYQTSDLRYKLTRNLINKEARFLFSKTPDFLVKVDKSRVSEDTKKALDEQESQLQTLVDKVLKANHMSSILLKAAKDCFIGKRVACIVNFNEENGIQISFIPSLEFVYDVDPENSTKLTKLVAFYTIKDDKVKSEQRVYKKKYWLDNGACYFNENIYDGNGVLVEEQTPDTRTELEEIPAVVIINDGLSGDLLGESEINQLTDYESYYTKLANADIDAERKSMNPVHYAMDCSPESTMDLSSAAGAFWDLSSDPTKEGSPGHVGILESSMAYSGVLAATLDRVKTSMYEQVDVPDITSDKLQGIVTSGKTIKALYYPLIVRCDEKMLAWRPALESVVRFIIEGAKKYPEISAMYVDDIPEIEYEINVDNQYPLPEDEAEEKAIDMSEVGNQVMSRKAYIKKWRGLTDDEADAEIQQIAQENAILAAAVSFGVPKET